MKCLSHQLLLRCQPTAPTGHVQAEAMDDFSHPHLTPPPQRDPDENSPAELRQLQNQER